MKIRAAFARHVAHTPKLKSDVRTDKNVHREQTTGMVAAIQPKTHISRRGRLLDVGRAKEVPPRSEQHQYQTEMTAARASESKPHCVQQPAQH